MDKELGCEIRLLTERLEEFSWLCAYAYEGARARGDENCMVFAALRSIADSLAVKAGQINDELSAKS